MFRSVAAAAIAAGVISTALVGSAQARITEIKIDTVEPFAEGQPFGEAGSYERVSGIAKGELDPQSPQNHAIVDLDKAPRNARGLRRIRDRLLHSASARSGRGNGVIFYEVNNRGRKALLARIDEAPPTTTIPAPSLDAGLGFSLGRGYTIVWSGWDPDAPDAPTAALARASRSRPMTARRSCAASARNSRSAPAAMRAPNSRSSTIPPPRLDKSTARLTVRAREGDPASTFPRWLGASRTAARPSPAGGPEVRAARDL